MRLRAPQLLLSPRAWPAAAGASALQVVDSTLAPAVDLGILAAGLSIGSRSVVHLSLLRRR